MESRNGADADEGGLPHRRLTGITQQEVDAERGERKGQRHAQRQQQDVIEHEAQRQQQDEHGERDGQGIEA
jgi:hypothetical protein